MGNTKVVVVLTAGMFTIAVIVTCVLTTVLSGPYQWYLVGAVHVGAVGGVLHLLNAGFLASDREAIWHVRGAWGEENTRDELRRAKRRRLIWDWVDSIALQVGDVDHLVITRAGGLLAIDSKWRNSISRTDTTSMAQSAQKARKRAEGLARTLLTKERGTHRARMQSLTALPVVVVWGAAQQSVPDDAMVDGVRFIAGRKLVNWLKTLDGEPVTRHAAKDAADRLRDYRATASQNA